MSNWREIQGWLDEENYKMFQDIKLSKSPTILEIGTHRGKSSTMMRELWPNSSIITCDIDDYEASLPDNVKFVHSSGQNLEWNKPIDLLFIDSSHTYDDTKELFEKYESFIKKGGYVVFHDYHKEGSEVDGIRIYVHRLIDLGYNIKTYNTGEYGGAVWRKDV